MMDDRIEALDNPNTEIEEQSDVVETGLIPDVAAYTTKAAARKARKVATKAAFALTKIGRIVSATEDMAESLRTMRREVFTDPRDIVEGHGTWGYCEPFGRVIPEDNPTCAKEGYYYSHTRHAWRRPGLGGQSGNGKSVDELRQKYGVAVY
jgi:hypothetical protein